MVSAGPLAGWIRSDTVASPAQTQVASVGQRESSDTSVRVTTVVDRGGVTDSPMRRVTRVSAASGAVTTGVDCGGVGCGGAACPGASRGGIVAAAHAPLASEAHNTRSNATRGPRLKSVTPELASRARNILIHRRFTVVHVRSLYPWTAHEYAPRPLPRLRHPILARTRSRIPAARATSAAPRLARGGCTSRVACPSTWVKPSTCSTYRGRRLCGCRCRLRALV